MSEITMSSLHRVLN